MRNRFRKYMRGPQWLSKTMIIAETCWHFPQCCFAKSFPRVHVRPSATFQNNDYSWEGLTFSSISCFQKYMTAPQWLSKTMIIAERGWHFPQCRCAKLFSKIHDSPSMTFKNNDCSWEGLTFSSMLLCEIVFKRTCEALSDSQKQWL